MAGPQTIFFLGATGGCGLSTLWRSIAAGHTCIALCRTPSRFTDKLPESQRNAANLRIEEGNALDQSAVAKCLVKSTETNTRLVDTVVFTIGGAFQISKFANDDPHTLLAALSDARKGIGGATGLPKIIAISTTGLSAHGRDFPLTLWPLYHFLLKEAHVDKKAMETLLIESGESFVIVRPSLLKDGEDETNEKRRPVRVGVEDPSAGKLESKEVGFMITRDDVGRWIFEEALGVDGGKWTGKVVSVTY
ncbi:Isoflavone reductase [Cytospora mali]|uniref:Isoflavone reductase n=1 Tax=Cytospora mali TaxID=578113 RepID=A0A194VDK2_CYTMA|nr:Isoflavone reductase [Valsa mali var. pyri (nom. inval.)]